MAQPSTSSSSSAVATAHKPRPARKQVTQERLRALIEAAKPQNSSGGIYNIWHENFSGGDRNERKGFEKAPTRCDIARDAGYTKADSAVRRSTAGGTADNDGAYICLFFSRGCCPNGSECTYLHRLPRPAEFNDQGRDIFGRPKFGDYRDDMGGVGSMQRVNRTLYVGRIHEEISSGVSQGGGANMSSSLSWRDGGRTLRGGKSASDVRRRDGAGAARGPRQPYVESDTEKVIRRHFSEWGDLERVKVLHGRACAFVTYKHEGAAQFAKEAMYQQSLDHSEVINVRWSTDDPNPGAQKRNERQLRQQGEGAIASTILPETIEAQEALRRLEGAAEGDDGPEPKRRRTQQEIEEEAAYEAEMARLDEENARGWEEIAKEQQAAAEAAAAAAAAQAQTQTQTPNGAAGSGGGLFNAEMMGNLQALSALRQKQQQLPQAAAAAKPAATSGLGSLAAYGSDSEEDEEES